MTFTRLSFVFITLAIPSLAAAQSDLGRTVIIGDSITEASKSREGQPTGGAYSWRYSFWQQLVDHGVDATFVGSRTSNFGGSVTYPSYTPTTGPDAGVAQTFTNTHEAIWGTTASERASTLAPAYGSLNADTAYLLIGINDINALSGGGDDTTPAQETAIRDDIQTIVQGLRGANPNVTVNVISIMHVFNSRSALNDDVDAVNDLLEAMAATSTNANSLVRYVDITGDLGAPLLTASLFYDGVHPNRSGEDYVGLAVYQQTVNTPAPTALPAGLVAMGLLAVGRVRRR